MMTDNLYQVNDNIISPQNKRNCGKNRKTELMKKGNCIAEWRFFIILKD